MMPKQPFFVPNLQKLRKNGTILCHGRFRAEKAGTDGSEWEKAPIRAVSVTVASREKP